MISHCNQMFITELLIATATHTSVIQSSRLCFDCCTFRDNIHSYFANNMFLLPTLKYIRVLLIWQMCLKIKRDKMATV